MQHVHEDSGKIGDLECGLENAQQGVFDGLTRVRCGGVIAAICNYRRSYYGDMQLTVECTWLTKLKEIRKHGYSQVAIIVHLMSKADMRFWTM